MSDRDTPRGKSLLDQAKDAIDDFFGGNAEEAAAQTPTAVADRMDMNQHELEDIGMAPRGLDSAGDTGSPRPGSDERATTALDPF